MRQHHVIKVKCAATGDGCRRGNIAETLYTETLKLAAGAEKLFNDTKVDL